MSSAQHNDGDSHRTGRRNEDVNTKPGSGTRGVNGVEDVTPSSSDESQESEIVAPGVESVLDEADNHRGQRGSRERSRSGGETPPLPPRLMVASSRVKNLSILQNALQNNVLCVQYKYEQTTLDGILALVAQTLGSKKVESIALVMHGTPTAIHISGKDEKAATKENILEHQSLRSLFLTLVENHLDCSWVNARLDFLACNVAQNVDGSIIADEIASIVKVPVGISKDITGADIKMERVGEENVKYNSVGELYFKMEKLKNFAGPNQQSLAGFEKIRTVGKGAYGTAILYRKKDDDSLVILKEINLHDLNASERQLALNEVKVLAMLDHPNIISYYDSFEEDGIVMIEMEYADGGTLSQFLAQQEKPMEEREILSMFHQIVAAIKHIHDHNILHRDLKTANIFLTKEGVIKVGDFGISKMMSTSNQGANTVLGTPYYISPEMCEGKAYNDRSDIWAMGCILYEMACLQKTFEGSNLPALVNKIMKGQFAPVKGSYTQEFKLLVRDMLQREPEYRPSANDLWHNRLPELLSRYEDPVTDYEDDLVASSDHTFGRRRKTSPQHALEKRSVLYYFEMNSMSLSPIGLPSKVKIRDVAVGRDHVTVVTIERMIYTWGDNSKGQLGHGDLDFRNKPQLVEALKGKSIIRACCGQGFSVFSSDNGIVMTCGDGTSGCLGHGDWCSTSRPRLIEDLLSVDVIAIAAGPQHVVAVGSDSEVFSWGGGGGGRLGLGNDEDYCEPMQVQFTDTVCVRDVRCGRDGTMLLTDVGSVLACGNNEFNKLCLNARQGFLMAMKNIFNKTEIEGVKVFTLVRALARYRVVDICMNNYHAAVVVEPGHVYTFGRNTEGQLGTGNTRPQNAPVEVKVFEEKMAFRVQCGEYYCVGGTTHNDLLFWGTRFKNPPKLDDSWNLGSRGSNNRELRVESAGSTNSVREAGSRHRTPSAGSGKDDPGSANSSKSGRDVGAQRPVSSDGTVTSQTTDKGTAALPPSTPTGFRPLSSTIRRTVSQNSNRDSQREVGTKDDTELILQPAPLLRMDTSGSYSPAGETVTLSNFFCHGENLFIEVETTAPPPKRRSRRRRFTRTRNQFDELDVTGGGFGRNQRMSASSRDGGDEYSSEASEYDTYGTIPAWIKQELRNVDDDDVGNDAEVDDTSDHSDDDVIHKADVHDSSMSSIQINKDLSHGHRAKGDRGADDGRGSRHKGSHDGSQQKHMSSTESGVDVQGDHLSSSSSSEHGKAAVISSQSEEKVKVSRPSVKPAPQRKLAGPQPYKSKMGPQAQKPLNRIRAQSKGTRTRLSAEGKDGIPPKSSDSSSRASTYHNIQADLQRMKEEKAQTEAKLKKLEDEYRRREEERLRESERKSTEREEKLKGEIVNLRDELRNQSTQMKNNNDIVRELQNQLEKVQTEQMRISQNPSRLRTDSRQSVQRESKICAIQ